MPPTRWFDELPLAVERTIPDELPVAADHDETSEGKATAPRDWVLLWVPDTVRRRVEDGGPIRYAASAQLSRAQPGDTVWIVTVEGRRIDLVGRVHVDEVVDRDQAEERLDDEDLWDAPTYALATPGTETGAALVDLDSVAPSLRFQSKTAPKLRFDEGAILAQQLQTMRLLEPESARQLAELWTGPSEAAESGVPIRKGEATVTLVEVEQQHVEMFEVERTAGPVKVRRSEQSLVLGYCRFLEARGEQLTRLRALPQGVLNCLYSDVFNEERGQLVEAKGEASRAAIRMAIGQLFDYRRFAPDAELAVLLPERPSSDLEELLSSVQIAAIWRDGDSFMDNVAGRFI